MVTTFSTVDTETREVLRNLALNPNAVSGGAGAFNRNNTTTHTLTLENIGSSSNPQGIVTRAKSQITAGTVTPSILSLYNIDGLNAANPARWLGAWVYVNIPNAQARLGNSGAYTPIPNGQWTWITSPEIIPANTQSLAFVNRVSGNAAETDIAYITGVTALTTGAPTATVAGGTSYPSAAAPDPGLAPSWVGTPNASESILTGVFPVHEVMPILVDGYEATREAFTVVHPILNKTFPDVTLRPAGPRKGRLRMLFATEAEAVDAYAAMAYVGVFTVTDPDVPGIGMRFVVADGDLGIGLDDTTRNAWWVEVPFVEIAP